jgi:2,4-dienoyl-CoA reductase-like NADH-dependent reductase (Old Yellow Enzyme family)/thioredoxin reductase
MAEARNKFIMAPVKLGYCNDLDGRVTQRHLDFYYPRTKHVGYASYEPLYLSKSLRELPAQLGIDDDDKIEGLKNLINITNENGAKAIAHLNHPGRMANPKIPGNLWVSSTDKNCKNGGGTPVRMNESDINDAIQLFLDAAKRAEKAGFDAVELQFGQGYLVSQFLSPAVNDRTDKYGGSFKNRSRFALELLDAIKKEIDLPVFIRMTAAEFIPNGIDITEAIELAIILKENGIEAAHIVTGSVCDTPPWYFQHMFIPKGKNWEFAKKIRMETGIPVVTVGRITCVTDIDRILKEYGSDYIALGRPLVADPDFLGKYLGLIQGNVRPCLSCSESCVGGVRAGIGLHCVVNPSVGNDSVTIEPASIKKNIAVIGGGIAGMEAAVRLKERGHSVTIFEKGRLGGQFNLAWLPPKKESLKNLIDFYEKEIEDNKIVVEYKEADASILTDGKFDEVVVATGAKPIVPKIKGLDKYDWAEILELNELPVNKRILIIGGGLIGLEVANKLVENNNEIIIVELLDEIGRDMEMIEKNLTLQNLKQKKAIIYTNHKVIEVKEEGRTVVIEGEKIIELKNIDRIIAAIGMQSENQLAKEPDAKIPVHFIGDAVKPSKVQNAIADGYNVGIKI